MKKSILINNLVNRCNYTLQPTEYDCMLYSKDIELLTVFDKFLMFSTYTIKSNVTIEGETVRIEGIYGIDGCQVFYDGRISDLTKNEWFSAMKELHCPEPQD